MIEFKDTAVICLDHSENSSFLTSLRDAGFGTVVALHKNESVRDAMSRTLAEGNAYILTVNTQDGFTLADLKVVAQALHKDDSAIYLGARNIAGKQKLPSKLFGFLSGLKTNDIESSLLGMSEELCRKMLRMKSKDASFLHNILLEARAQEIDIKEIPTDACCSQQPGFEVLGRSAKLYYVFIKFSIAALLAYLVDIGTFYWFVQLFHSLPNEYKILLATVLSRVLCSITTYILNKGAVFQSQSKTTGEVVRFIILAVGQLLASWLLVLGIGTLLGGGDISDTMVKVVVDLVIFIASFSIQRDWVFKKSNHLPN